eukprot:c4625_g1_i1.p1 GENE.c4625_g1_i1~~c4625_g1_i1.p1  ORF type:complete len:548 (+),score=114.62 c4625_g1_i1:212-1645(+)
MGENEWIAVRSAPAPLESLPYFDVQTTQVIWNTDGCQPFLPSITVAKDVGIKCGNVNFLYKTTRGTANARNCPANDKYAPNVDYEQIFVSGVMEGGTKYDFQQFVVGNKWRQRFYFDGRARSFMVSAMPCENGCQKNWPSGQTTQIDFWCDDATITIYAYRGGGASHSQVVITTPDASQTNSIIRNTNMISGFCGGWSTASNAPQIMKDAAAKYARCRDPSTVSQTYYYLGSGVGTPGSAGRGVANEYKNAVSLFYTTDACRDFFVPNDVTSIFRLFEVKTKGKNPSYDSLRWSSDGTSVIPGDTAAGNPARKIEAQNACEAMRKSVDNRPLTSLDSKAAKDATLLAMVSMCAEDYYLGVVWDNRKFSQMVCGMIQGYVNRERTDIKCADLAMRGFKLDNTRIGADGFSAESDTAIKAYLKSLSDMAFEVRDSQANIEFWDNGECVFDNLDLTKNPVDCSRHTFTNTRDASAVATPH